MKKFIVILIVILTLSGCGAPRLGSAAPPEEMNTERASVQPALRDPVPQAGPALREALTLSIPEGYTLVRIGMALEEMGVATAAEFVEAAQTLDFSGFPLLGQMPQNPGRFFALEGYLFPGVYKIYPSEPPESIIRRILLAAEDNIDEGLRRDIAQSGRTVDEVMILASIIQRESLGSDDAKPLVSAVIHNRLNTGMMLQMCKTSFYVRDYINLFYEGESDRFHAYYNTYMFRGLPAGPICNPGLSAIRAALSPAQADYFFYIWDEYDNFHFAATWEEHVANVEKYLR